MTISAGTLVRLVGFVAGVAAGTMLVRALDEGFAHEPRPFTPFHGLFGILTAMVAMPGTLLGFLVKPASSERARGLAVGGCVVTALFALVAGTVGWLRRDTPEDGGLHYVLLGWAAVVLPLALVDTVRLRVGGDGTSRGNSDSGR